MSWSRHRLASLLLLACACLASEVDDTDASTMSATLPCDSAIDESSAVPASYVTVLDVAAFVAVEPGEALERAEADGERTFTKTGLVVRGDTSFRIEVSDDSTPNVLLSWAGEPVGRIEVTGCGDQGAWLAFPGGYWVLEAECASLVVSRGVEQERVRVPIGVPCEE